MKQNISLSDFYTKIEPSNSRLKSRVCDGVTDGIGTAKEIISSILEAHGISKTLT